MSDPKKVVDDWNEKYPSGAIVEFEIATHGGTLRVTGKALSEAKAIGDMSTPCVWVSGDGVSGWMAISGLKVVNPKIQYSASTSDTWCEPYASEEGAITEAVGAWWDSYAEEDDREVEVEVGEIVWASPADYLFAESVIESVIDNIDHNYSAFDGYDPIPSDHRDARGLPCIDPAIAKSITDELQPALREVLRTWWERHSLETWFEVPSSRTVKVRVKVDEHGDLAGWEVEQ